MCSSCEVIDNNLTLNDRSWTCSSCNATHDRDINAAINIKNIGLKTGKKFPGVSVEKDCESFVEAENTKSV